MKYRQHGYQDRDAKPREKPSEGAPRKKDDSFGPRALRMPASTNVSRCAQCGTLLKSLSEPLGRCAKCGFELHSCKQCSFFDPSSRFECTQPVPQRIPRKDVRNDCTFYAISVRV